MYGLNFSVVVMPLEVVADSKPVFSSSRMIPGFFWIVVHPL